MEIAILVEKFPPKYLGGTEIAAYNLSYILTKDNYEVHLITSYHNSIYNGSNKIGFNVYPVNYGKLKFLSTIVYLIKIFFKLLVINPDIIHIQSYVMGLPALFYGKIKGKPVITWTQGSEVYVKNYISIIVLRLLLKHSTRFLALSQNMRNELLKIHFRRIDIMPNGINLKNFKNIIEKNIRKKLNIDQNTTLLLFVGSIRPIKGLKYLIESLLFLEGEDVKLLIIGHGKNNYLKYLLNIIKDNKLESKIIFIDQIDNKLIPKYMKTADIFILPSISESFGIVNLEAMASGLPIIATKVGGIPEIVKNYENGFLVDPKNPKQIADRIKLLIYKKNYYNYISNNNKKIAKNFDWKIIVKKIEKIYDELNG